MDDIRPRGTIQVKCSVEGCEWQYWVDALDPSLPNGPFYCVDHDPDPSRCPGNEMEKAE